MIVLRVLVTVGLVGSAVIHVQLAPGFQQAAPGGIGAGNLFRIQPVTAVLAELYVLIRGDRAVHVVAAVAALSALAAVVLNRYVQVPAIGPMPSMYEPVWYAKKALTASGRSHRRDPRHHRLHTPTPAPQTQVSRFGILRGEVSVEAEAIPSRATQVLGDTAWLKLFMLPGASNCFGALSKDQ